MRLQNTIICNWSGYKLLLLDLLYEDFISIYAYEFIEGINFLSLVILFYKALDLVHSKYEVNL